MALLNFPLLRDARCQSLDIQGRLLLGRAEYTRLRKHLKTRSKSLHATIGRFEKTNEKAGTAFSEHFGIDVIDSETLQQLAEVPRRCAEGEAPTALFHWSAQAFESEAPLPELVEDRASVERVVEWMKGLSPGLEVRVSAVMDYPANEYDCIVALPLVLPTEQLGGFTEVPGVWFVKREGDAAAGPSMYDVFASRRSERLVLRVRFSSIAKGTAETIQSLLDAARQIASFVVNPAVEEARIK